MRLIHHTTLQRASLHTQEIEPREPVNRVLDRESWPRSVTVIEGFGTPLRVADIAAHARVHPVTLAKAFRHRHGVSPAEYLREVRLTWARDILHGSSRPLADIALCAGFWDQSHFTRLFTRRFDTLPVPPGGARLSPSGSLAASRVQGWRLVCARGDSRGLRYCCLMSTDTLSAPALSELVRALVRIPSVNPSIAPDEGQGEENVAAFVRDWLMACGVKAWLEEPAPGRPNVVGRTGTSDGPTIVLCAHLDTVGTAGLTIEPFESTSTATASMGAAATT